MEQTAKTRIKKKNRSKLLAASKACFHLVSVECRGGVVVQRAARPRVGAVDAVQAARENRRAVRCCWKALQSLAAEGIMHCYLLRYGHIRTWALRSSWLRCHVLVIERVKLKTRGCIRWCSSSRSREATLLQEPQEESKPFRNFYPNFELKKRFFFTPAKFHSTSNWDSGLTCCYFWGNDPSSASNLQRTSKISPQQCREKATAEAQGIDPASKHDLSTRARYALIDRSFVSKQSRRICSEPSRLSPFHCVLFIRSLSLPSAMSKGPKSPPPSRFCDRKQPQTALTCTWKTCDCRRSTWATTEGWSWRTIQDRSIAGNRPGWTKEDIMCQRQTVIVVVKLRLSL